MKLFENILDDPKRQTEGKTSKYSSKKYHRDNCKHYPLLPMSNCQYWNIRFTCTSQFPTK